MSKISLPLKKSIPKEVLTELSNRLCFIDPSIGDIQLTPSLFKSKYSGQNEQKPEVERKIIQYIKEFCESHFVVETEILVDRSSIQCRFKSSPYESLIELGHLKEELPGVYSQGPLLLALKKHFYKKFDALKEEYAIQEYQFPTLMNPEILERSGYLSEYPQNAGFVSHLEEDIEQIQTFSKALQQKEFRATDVQKVSNLKTKAILSPAVCYHLYPFLEGKPIPEEGIWATAEGKCFRYESKNMNSLERLWDFSMKEFIYVGLEEKVVEFKEVFLHKHMPEFLDSLGLNYQIMTANDPFFMSADQTKATFQRAFKLKFEAQVLLPFSNKQIACASVNYHQGHFGKTFNLEVEGTSDVAHSFCFAIGIERLCYAFIAQHGINSKNWPIQIEF